MAYDIRGGWDSFTGFNAPLYKTSVDTTNEFNVVRKKEANFTLQKHKQKCDYIINPMYKKYDKNLILLL